MKFLFGKRNLLRKENEILSKEIVSLNSLREENKVLQKEVENLNPFRKENEELLKEIENLNNLRKENKEFLKEIENLSNLKEVNEKLCKEIENLNPLKDENEALCKVKNAYQIMNKPNFNIDAIHFSLNLGIRDNQLIEILKPIFDAHPLFKNLFEKEKEKIFKKSFEKAFEIMDKMRQEASFRSEGGGSSSSITNQSQNWLKDLNHLH